MDFKTYQKKARETAQYPDLGSNNIYPTLGLVGEAGEVADKVKKVIRDKNGIFDNESKLGIKKELGDVLWYISNLCTELNFNLDDVALQNLEKLKLRAAKGKISGSGDDRWIQLYPKLAYWRFVIKFWITFKSKKANKDEISNPPIGGIIPLKMFK